MSNRSKAWPPVLAKTRPPFDICLPTAENNWKKLSDCYPDSFFCYDMNWFSKYHAARKLYWPTVEQFFGNLPPSLHRRATLLKNDLAIQYSDTGQFADILSRQHDHPLLYLHFWLQDDWHLPAGSLSPHLLPPLVFAFAGAVLQQFIGDDSSGFDAADAGLVQILWQQSGVELAQLFPNSSLFWPAYHDCWQEYAETLLAAPATPSTERLLAGRWAFAKIPLAAGAFFAGQTDELPQLLSLADQFNAVYQTQLEIFTLLRDAKQGRLTNPIRQIMEAAGIDPHQPVSPERILGAAVLTGTVTALCRQNAARLQQGRDAAKKLNLPTFAGYFAAAAEFVEQTGALFSLTAKSPAAVTIPAMAPAVDSLATAIEAAEAYLLSDLSFRGSWDVQRSAKQELTAKAFPAGLVVEILARTGHAVQPQVEQVFAQLRASGYRYYPLPDLPPDADDLGLLLRLFRYLPAQEQPAARRQLAVPLRQMAAAVLPSGEIPVWFQTDAVARQSPPLVWGGSCATTEVNLLLGLLQFDWPAYRSIVQNSVRFVFHRFETKGLGAAHYYVTPYVLWSAFKLMAELRAGSFDPDLRQQVERAEAPFVARFERATGQPVISPQTAAFFALTEAPVAQTLARWRDRLLKSQRHDGSWPAEPLFLIPHGQRTAWYASRLVTSAFCYWALVKFQERG